MVRMTGMRLTSSMFCPPMRTASVNGFRRAPWHVGQGRSAMYSSILDRM